MTSWTTRCLTRAAFLFVGCSMLVSACAESPSAPQAEGGFAATGVVAQGQLIVRVHASDGQTIVPAATVRVYGLRSDQTVGPLATGITNALGKATFPLPAGGYCISARLAPPEWLTLDIVTPPTSFQYTPTSALYGPVVSVPAAGEVITAYDGGSGHTYASFTPSNFESCYTALPVTHGQDDTWESVALAEPFFVTPQVMDLNGQPLTGIDVFAVMPVNVPWSTPSDPEVKTAFFSIVDQTSSPADLVVSPHAPWALEFQQPWNGFNITGTAKGMGGGSGSTMAFEMEAAPLMCLQTTQHFAAGARGIDFLQTNFGYHATLALEPDESMVAVQIRHAGNGPVSITFRTDLPTGHLTTIVDFVCADGSCGPASVKTPGRNEQSVQVFHAPKGGTEVKTSIVLGGIPDEHVRVTFFAKSPGDAIPLAARDRTTSAFFLVPRSERCSVQQSNDDKWAIGDL